MTVVQSLTLVSLNLIFLVFLKIGVEGYLISTIGANMFVTVISFFAVNMHKDLCKASFDKNLMKEMIKYSAPLVISDISWWIIHSADKMMIEAMIGAACLGIYSVAAKLPALINVVTTIFTQAWRLSSIREYDSSNDVSFYTNVFKYLFIVMFGASIVIVSIIKPFMKLYVSDHFFEAWKYVPLLILAATYSAFAYYTDSMYSAIKISSHVMWTTMLSAIINIAINYILIPRIGILGAVLGTFLSYFFVSIARMIDVWRYVKINYSLNKFIPLAILTLIHCSLVTIDWHICIVSLLTCLVYIVIVIKDIKNGLIMANKFLKRSR